MVYYSGGLGDIQSFLGQILTVGVGEADLLTEPICQDHQRRVDNRINSALSTTVAVPLIKITRGDVVKYPDPVPFIAIRMVVASLIATYFKDVQPSDSARAKSLEEEAIFDLNNLVNGLGAGSRRLEGQKLIGKNRFAPSQIVPIPIEGKPIAGPSGGVG